MLFKQLLLIPYINDDVFYLYLIDIFYKNDFQLLAIYHNSLLLNDYIVLEVIKYSDPIVYLGNYYE